MALRQRETPLDRAPSGVRTHSPNGGVDCMASVNRMLVKDRLTGCPDAGTRGDASWRIEVRRNRQVLDLDALDRGNRGATSRTRTGC
jgi:hypothetical protein